MRRLIGSLLPRFSTWNRRRKASIIRRFAGERKIRSVLLVGVGWGGSAWEYIVESGATADADLVVACDIHPRSQVPWSYVSASGLALPFGDDSFDLVLSNAVIEHVGGEGEQRRFVAEHARVGRDWIITTPNRWFPVESHTAAVFLHWSRAWRRRQDETFTRLLSISEFADLLPSGHRIHGNRLSPTLVALSLGRPDADLGGNARSR